MLRNLPFCVFLIAALLGPGHAFASPIDTKCGSFFGKFRLSNAFTPSRAKAPPGRQLPPRIQELRDGYFRALAAGDSEQLVYHRLVLEEALGAAARKEQGLPVLAMRDDFDGEHLGRRWPHVGERKVKYFTPEEAAQFEVHVGKDGLLRRSDSSLLDTRFTSDGQPAAGPAIFSMDPSGRLFVYQGPELSVAGYHFHVLGDPATGELVKHSSLTAGLPSAGAGHLKVQAGRLLYLDPASGHYRTPPAFLRQVAEELRRQGADLSGAQIRLRP